MPHDPATMAFLSSLGHWIVGGFVLAVAVVMVFEAQHGLQSTAWRFLAPSLIVSTGLALALFIIFHAGFDRAFEMLSHALSDPQQIQHFIIAGATVLIGLAEARARRARFEDSTWRFVWPIAYFAFGLGLILHEQTGPDAEAIWRYHVLLGLVVMIAGAARLCQVTRAEWFRRAGYIFSLSLAAEALLLLLFRAPAAG